MYDTEGEVYYDDARKIDPNELPDLDPVSYTHLKQPLYHPYSMHEEVIILCCAQRKPVSYTHLLL